MERFEKMKHKEVFLEKNGFQAKYREYFDIQWLDDVVQKNFWCWANIDFKGQQCSGNVFRMHALHKKNHTIFTDF